MTNGQARLIALAIFSVASCVVATQPDSGNLRGIGFILSLVSMFLFGLELLVSFRNKD